MATSIDKHLLRLLAEFTEFCGKNAIRFVLANHSAWDAAKFHKYHGDMYETAVLMERDQFERLKEVDLPAHRSIVRFGKRGCEAKYVDERSVLLDFRDCNEGIEPYVGIEISVADKEGDGFKLKKPDGTSGRLPLDAFDHIGAEKIEGIPFPTFEDMGAYLTLLAGKDWKTATYPHRVPTKSVATVHVENIDHDLFMSQPVVKKSLTKRYQLLRLAYWAWTRNEYKPAVKHYEDYQNYLARTEDRFLLWEQYYPMKSIIMELAQDPDNAALLDVILSDLLDKMRHYKELNLGFSIDEDLLQVCIPFLVEKYGQKEADEIIVLIPPEYREQDIAAILRERGVAHPLLEPIEGS